MTFLRYPFSCLFAFDGQLNLFPLKTLLQATSGGVSNRQGGSIRPPPHISNVFQKKGLQFLHKINMYINYICANF